MKKGTTTFSHAADTVSDWRTCLYFHALYLFLTIKSVHTKLETQTLWYKNYYLHKSLHQISKDSKQSPVNV